MCNDLRAGSGDSMTPRNRANGALNFLVLSFLLLRVLILKTKRTVKVNEGCARIVEQVFCNIDRQLEVTCCYKDYLFDNHVDALDNDTQADATFDQDDAEVLVARVEKAMDLLEFTMNKRDEIEGLKRQLAERDMEVVELKRQLTSDKKDNGHSIDDIKCCNIVLNEWFDLPKATDVSIMTTDQKNNIDCKDSSVECDLMVPIILLHLSC